MTRIIEIEIATEKRTIKATFTCVRKAGASELGWVELSADDGSYRFPGIVHPAQNARGYSVYTVDDWQAPASTFGDISDPIDWARLTMCGTGQFTGRGAKASANGINITGFRLPVTPEQWDYLAHEFGFARVELFVGHKPGQPRRRLLEVTNH